jgi:hypothetical protein
MQDKTKERLCKRLQYSFIVIENVYNVNNTKMTKPFRFIIFFERARIQES